MERLYVCGWVFYKTSDSFDYFHNVLPQVTCVKNNFLLLFLMANGLYCIFTIFHAVLILLSRIAKLICSLNFIYVKYYYSTLFFAKKSPKAAYKY